jgi:SWI/SNF-related matrix-associated actin-dependent regulator 1 of chromatin subfamily A
MPPTPNPSSPWFTPQPFPYQTQGALAALTGHPIIADEPGLGKTIQALLAIAIKQPTRTLITCPPALTTNWTYETKRSGILTHALPHNSTLTTITPQTRNPTLPNTGIIITSDTLLTARPTLAQKIHAWNPQMLIADEAHRYKNPTTKRTRTLLNLAKNTPTVIALTGTPITSSPLDILPLLRLTKTTHHFPHNFTHTYCEQNYFGNYIPNPKTLPDLYMRLTDHAWIRRTKADVLPQLPAKARHTHHISLQPKELATAYEEVRPQLLTTQEDDPRGLISALRRLTGLAKIPEATRWILEHQEGTRRPLIAWAIHTSVLNGLQQALQQANPNLRTAIYNGQTTAEERDNITRDFQNGHIDILIAQITAAGVGLTLTRASEALFVETEWTPAAVVQAEDRIHRISQTHPVTITTLLAENTLDEPIHRVLQEKIKVLDQLTPGSDHHVTDQHANRRVTDLLEVIAESFHTQLKKGLDK